MGTGNSIVPIFILIIFSFFISCEGDEYVEGEKVNLIYQSATDQEGNTYKTIKIGTQVWMAENLRVTRYRDGTLIARIGNGQLWDNASAGAWCDYENREDQEAAYGRLYNWYAVNDPRGLAPAGWHIPSESEWEILAAFLGGETIAGSKLKEKGATHWNMPNTGATNESGFAALPAGARGEVGQYCFLGTVGFWWSSNPTKERTAFLRGATNNSTSFVRFTYNKEYGFSVRCLKD